MPTYLNKQRAVADQTTTPVEAVGSEIYIIIWITFAMFITTILIGMKRPLFVVKRCFEYT